MVIVLYFQVSYLIKLIVYMARTIIEIMIKTTTKIIDFIFCEVLVVRVWVVS